MKLLISVNGEDYYSEEFEELISEDPFSEELIKAKEYVSKIHTISIREKYEKVKGRNKNCQLYMVFESKMNEQNLEIE